MKPISNQAVERLRMAASIPDMDGTRYQLGRELGRGGMGVVYAAHDTELEREVAVKVLHLDDVSPELAVRMKREARTLARLEHPNIVPIYDTGLLEGGRLFYVMKLVAGERLDAYRDRVGRLQDRLRLVERICEAVAFAHDKGVLHRDLKPENIMVGEFGQVLIMDWGLAKLLNEDEPPRVLGTPQFMSPEQARGEGGVDHRTDIYSLGRIVAYLAGDTPPRVVRSVIAKACAADAAARYGSAAELGNDLLSYLDGLPVSAHKETLMERARRFYGNNRTLLLLVFTYVAVRFLVFFWTRP